MEGNQNKDPKGGGNPSPTQPSGDPKNPQSWILDKFKKSDDPVIEQLKSTVESQSQLGKVTEELHRLKEEQGKGVTTFDQAIEEKETEIEVLKDKITEIEQRPVTTQPQPVYDPDTVTQFETLFGLTPGTGIKAINVIRGIPAIDRRQEKEADAIVENKAALAKQYGEIKGNYDQKHLDEIAGEMLVVLKRYPELKARASKEPDVVKTLVQLAELKHEEKVQAQKAETEVRESEAAQAQTTAPGGVTIEDQTADRQKKMSIVELEKELGYGPDAPSVEEKSEIWTP